MFPIIKGPSTECLLYNNKKNCQHFLRSWTLFFLLDSKRKFKTSGSNYHQIWLLKFILKFSWRFFSIVINLKRILCLTPSTLVKLQSELGPSTKTTVLKMSKQKGQNIPNQNAVVPKNKSTKILLVLEEENKHIVTRPFSLVKSGTLRRCLNAGALCLLHSHSVSTHTML